MDKPKIIGAESGDSNSYEYFGPKIGNLTELMKLVPLLNRFIRDLQYEFAFSIEYNENYYRIRVPEFIILPHNVVRQIHEVYSGEIPPQNVRIAEFLKPITDQISLLAGQSDSRKVFIRSAISIEDTSTVPTAGLFKSYACDPSKDDPFKIIKTIYDSAHTKEITEYIKNEFKVNIIVQEFISSKISGVLFTINPLDGDRDKIIIESNFGQGDSVVSGKFHVDSFVVDKKALKNYIRDPIKRFMANYKENGQIEENNPKDSVLGTHGNYAEKKGRRDRLLDDFILIENVNEKEGFIDPESFKEIRLNGRSQELKNLDKARNRLTLTHSRIILLSVIGIILEEIFGYSIDMEWSFDEKNTLYLFQIRAAH